MKRSGSPRRPAAAVAASEVPSAGAALSPREFQAAFFRRMGVAQQLRALFEFLPDVDFFAKDAEGRFVAVSSRILWRVGATREEEVLGQTDDAIHPPKVAEAIREDDRRVMRTRQPLVDRVEALYARTRATEWFITTKVPVFDAQGEVIGIMGYVRPYRGGSGSAVEEGQIGRVVAHIHEHYMERLKIGELARLAHLSPRQLNRRFQETFRMSPQEFIVRTRIQAASDALLDTDKPLAEIAQEHRFYDQSAFTRQFREHIGETPLVFRRRRVRARSGG